MNTHEIIEKTKEQSQRLLSLGRAALYFTESIPLILVSNLYLNRGRNQPPTPEELKKLFKEIGVLMEKDIKNIHDGIYPSSVLNGRSPLAHAASLWKVMSDSVRVVYRMKTGKHKDFSAEAEDYAKDLPEYYTRNFHFQSDGYLSESSAQIYDHQVEILFNGTAQAMRRLAIPPIREAYEREEQLDILDVASGTGSLTNDLALTFPNSHITAYDLSFPYLKEAQRRLRKFPRMSFIQGDAEKMPFKDESFDVVTCCFLFHELPEKTRRNVIKECLRVKKKNGILVLTDSIQNGDNPEFEWALSRFPVNYHEPFFKNYLQHPLEGVVKDLTGKAAKTENGLFTKSVSTRHALKTTKPRSKAQ